jgi:hypothetical protein
MDDTPERDASPRKKRYTKPECRRVELKADEAVLGNCKSTGGGGPVQPIRCNSPLNCSTIGS